MTPFVKAVTWDCGDVAKNRLQLDLRPLGVMEDEIGPEESRS